jgi:hypothetical protein
VLTCTRLRPPVPPGASASSGRRSPSPGPSSRISSAGEGTSARTRTRQQLTGEATPPNAHEDSNVSGGGPSGSGSGGHGQGSSSGASTSQQQPTGGESTRFYPGYIPEILITRELRFIGCHGDIFNRKGLVVAVGEMFFGCHVLIYLTAVSLKVVEKLIFWLPWERNFFKESFLMVK